MNIFLEHKTSDCHKNYKTLLDGADNEVHVEEQISDGLVNKKVKNWQIFFAILQNIQFLAREGLAFCGNEDQGNFD